jgi:hypothetical protein
MSQTIAALLEEALRQKLHVQHAVLLQPIIEQAIAKQLRSMRSRLAFLLVRVAFASEQTRSLATNILGRQPGISPQVLNDILDHSAEAAKGKITKQSPQLADLIAEVEHWFHAQDRKNRP